MATPTVRAECGGVPSPLSRGWTGDVVSLFSIQLARESGQPSFVVAYYDRGWSGHLCCSATD
eukprot:COSAG02_NODE_4398_length_5406_cov_9.442623_4_plen_62_part_00